MKISKKIWLNALLVLLMAAALAACSDDSSTTGQGGQTQQCPSGESFNPLSGMCEVRSGTNNGTGGGTNNGTGGGTNNGTGGGLNNGTGGTNNGTGGGLNNGTGADAGFGSDGGTGGGGGTSDVGTGGTNNGTGGGACGPGTVLGKACAPSGEVLSGATVTIEGFDCDGNPYSDTAQTDSSGEYEFDNVPSGQQTLTISTGSFNRRQTIVVQAGQTLDLTTAAAKVCLDGGSVKIAVIDGAYDDVGGILDDLQLQYDTKGDDQVGGSIFNPQPPSSYGFLMDLNAMKQYDIIFINCGELWNVLQQTAPNDVPTIVANLKSFVEAGNSLYLADWEHPFLEHMYPDAVDFHGDDTNVNDARMGYAPQTITADVVSPGLQAALGHNQATIDFPHDPSANPPIINNNWIIADGVGAGATIHLSGDAQLCQQPFGSGFSGCDTPGNTQPDAVLLMSFKTPGDGTIIFTAFHNERQTSLNQDMDKILKYLIFQL